MKNTQHTPRRFPTLEEFKKGIARAAERVEEKKEYVQEAELVDEEDL